MNFHPQTLTNTQDRSRMRKIKQTHSISQRKHYSQRSKEEKVSGYLISYSTTNVFSHFKKKSSHLVQSCQNHHTIRHFAKLRLHRNVAATQLGSQAFVAEPDIHINMSLVGGLVHQLIWNILAQVVQLDHHFPRYRWGWKVFKKKWSFTTFWWFYDAKGKTFENSSNPEQARSPEKCRKNHSKIHPSLNTSYSDVCNL